MLNDTSDKIDTKGNEKMTKHSFQGCLNCSTDYFYQQFYSTLSNDFPVLHVDPDVIIKWQIPLVKCGGKMSASDTTTTALNIVHDVCDANLSLA